MENEDSEHQLAKQSPSAYKRETLHFMRDHDGGFIKPDLHRALIYAILYVGDQLGDRDGN